MIIGFLKEDINLESRIPIVPQSVKKLTQLGVKVIIEKDLGRSCYIEDNSYIENGAEIEASADGIIEKSQMIVRLSRPQLEDIQKLKKGQIHLSYLDPLRQKETVMAMQQQGVSSLSMEMIPRSTKAQKMDSLSSQASLGGYVAVLLAAMKSNKVFPMMMTPAGTLSPSRVFIIGAGVAGLQAIATAKRLGARVEAFDTRPVVREQVESLGAKFVEIDLGATGQTKDGYATALTEDQLARQRDGMKKICARSDVVITTAQVFGRKAPIIVTADMVAAMQPGSCIVDMAVETGGNVEGSVLGEEVELNGVTIIGAGNLPGLVPVHASEMYSSNVTYFISEFYDKDSQTFNLRLEDEIIRSTLITHEGAVVNEMVKKILFNQA